jgi:hypothetical protein
LAGSYQGIEVEMPAHSAYERDAHDAIVQWKELPEGTLERLSKRFFNPLGGVTGWLLKGPLGEGLGGVLMTTLTVVNDGASWTINKDAIFAKFNQAGSTRVRAAKDIFKLDLETVDEVVGRLDVGYVVAGVLEGAATGLEGGLGLALDIPLILGLNLRMIADYATHYGFDAQDPLERVYALGVLDFALAGSAEAKRTALDQLAVRSQAMSRGLSQVEMNKLGGTSARQLFVNSIGQRMAKAKVGQMVPVAGAAIGGGFNGWFTHKSCDAAYHLYRERFLDSRLVTV